jgi:lipopolysaccharide export LptBFGC system permease protein LptF
MATFTQVMVFYLLMIAVVTGIGYGLKGTQGALMGTGLSVMISLILWFTVGQKMVAEGKASY